jgi:hypothetical protein
MPTIPRYERNARLTTQAPSVTRSEQFAGAEGRAISQLGQAMGQVAQRWQQTVDTAQLNSYKARKEVSLADLQARANADQNPNNADTYIKELKKVKEKSLEGLNPRVKRVAEAELQKDLALAEIKIRNNFRKKTIKAGKKDLELATDTLSQDIINEENEKVRQDKLRQLRNTLNANVGTIISPTERDVILAEKEEEIREGKIDKDLYSNPEMFLENLKEYDFKDAEERSDKKKTAEGLIDRQEKLQRELDKDAVIKTRFEVISKIANGQVSPEDYPKILRNVFVDDYKLAEAIQKNIQKGGFTTDDLDREANAAFVNLSRKIFTSESEEKITGFLMDALTQNNKISRDRLAGLVWGAMTRAEELQKEGKSGFWSNLFKKVLNPAYAPQSLITNILSRFGKEQPQTEEDAKQIMNEEAEIDTGYSYEDLKYTAEKNGMTIEEVKNALKAQEE